MLYFKKLGWDLHLATAERGFNQKHWNGCKIHYINGFDDESPQPNICTPKLYDILADVNPDVVHVHNLMPFYIYSSIAGEKEYPTALTIHNTPNIPLRVFGTFNNFKAEMSFTRQLLKNNKYDHILFGSEYYLDSYMNIAPEIRGRSSVAYYYPPTITTGQLSSREKRNPESINILFPSRLLKCKGIEDMLHALKLLPSKYSLSLPAYANIEDLIYKQHLDTLINTLGVSHRVNLSTKITRPEDMKIYYEKADIAVIPSHYEGFGIAAVEAMSWGIPVIATSTGGLGEILSYSNGYTINTNSPTEITNAIQMISKDPVKTKSHVKNGFESIEKTFNINKHMSHIELTYNQIIRGHSERLCHEDRKMEIYQ